jgi:hypothetical protein
VIFLNFTVDVVATETTKQKKKKKKKKKKKTAKTRHRATSKKLIENLLGGEANYARSDKNKKKQAPARTRDKKIKVGENWVRKPEVDRWSRLSHRSTMKVPKCESCETRVSAALVELDGVASYMCRPCTEAVQAQHSTEALCDNCAIQQRQFNSFLFV